MLTEMLKIVNIDKLVQNNYSKPVIEMIDKYHKVQQEEDNSKNNSPTIINEYNNTIGMTGSCNIEEIGNEGNNNDNSPLLPNNNNTIDLING